MRKEFRVYYGGTLATKAQLDAIEEIVVEQEVDRAWEARIRIPVCIGEDGSWRGEDAAEHAEHARVRVEARIGEGDFIPLIEGEIYGREPDYNAAPGRSVVTLLVHDDTRKLHRETGSGSFSGQTDSEIASALFEAAALGESADVDDTAAGADNDAVINRRGTMMEMLRSLARRHGNFHAYVLPGSSAGTSKGCFKRFPVAPESGLPRLVLSGAGRNISGFRIQSNGGRATRYEAAHLSFSDHSVSTASAGPADSLAAGSTGSASTSDASLRTRRLPPGTGDHIDLSEAVGGMATESGYTLRADGAVIPSIYSAILSPYRMVAARVSTSRYSANYIIFKVVHTLGVSEYTQSFSVVGNTQSPDEGASAPLPAAAAATASNFNVQVGIF